MLTLFALPKPFEGHIGLIQENALASWSRLPDTEVILLGNDAGVAEAAARFGFQHVPDVRTNEHGTPMVDDIFARAQQMACGEMMIYVNADIILPPNLPQVIATAEHHFADFLLVGQRWDLDVTEKVDYDDPDWLSKLKLAAVTRGALHAQSGIDYFIFRKGFYSHVPPFAIGRMAWDNWLVLHARQRGAAVVDASEAIFIIHQNHDYQHVAGGNGNVWKGPETDANRKLFGLPSGQPGYIQNAATWRMTLTTLVPAQKAQPEALKGAPVPPWENVAETVTQAVERGDLDKAHRLLDDAQPHHGGLEEYHYVRAVVFANQKQVKKAAEAARQAMRVNPGSEPARALLEALGEDASTTWASAQQPASKTSTAPAQAQPSTARPSPGTTSAAQQSAQDSVPAGSLDRVLEQVLVSDADLTGKRVLDLGAGERAPRRVDTQAGAMIIARANEADAAAAVSPQRPQVQVFSLEELPSHLNGQPVDMVLLPDLHEHGSAANDMLSLAFSSLTTGGMLVASLVIDGPNRLTFMEQLEQVAKVEVEERFELPEHSASLDPKAMKPFNFQRADRNRPGGLLLRVVKTASPAPDRETTPPFSLEGGLHPMVRHGAERDRQELATTSALVDDAVKTMTNDPEKAAEMLRDAIRASYIDTALKVDDAGANRG